MVTTINNRCKLDGKQSVTIPISLKKNGRYLIAPVRVIVRGFLKFSGQETTDGSFFETETYQKNSANLLENKTVVYPVLFTSNEIVINNGRGTITLLPRSEDFLYDTMTILSRTSISGVPIAENITANEILQQRQVIKIQAGQIRTPYQVSIEITIIDETGKYYGQTVDRIGGASTDSSSLWKQGEKSITNNFIIEFYSDLEWIPIIDNLVEDNSGETTDVLQIIDNLSNEISFGASPMYDAIVKAASILSDNAIDEQRKLIYILTDNDSNMSVNSINTAIEEVNSIDGVHNVPIITGNFAIVSPITLSVKANITDTVDLNKLGFLTGGQSVTVVDQDHLNDIISIFYGEATGALGYGSCEFVVDMGEEVTIESITPSFYIPDERTGVSWTLSFSVDGYVYVEENKIFTELDVFTESKYTRYVHFKVDFITGFSSNEYLGEPESPKLNNFIISYNQPRISYLFLNKVDDNISPSQLVVGVDSNLIDVDSGQINVGLATSDAFNWEDFSTSSQPTVEKNGKIVIPIRYSQDVDQYTREPLSKVDKITLKTLYGTWDPNSSVTIYNQEGELISSSQYKTYPREGLVVFNSILPSDYKKEDYTIAILNKNIYKIGLEIINKSSVASLEVYGIGEMYTTSKSLLPPIEKKPPEANDVLILNSIPTAYDLIEVSYNYFDSNFDKEDTSKLNIKWFINNIHIDYLDNLKKWNDVSNPNDPLFKQAFSFKLSELESGVTVEEMARQKGQFIIKVGDTIYCFVTVSDGELYGYPVKSNVITVFESKPKISQLVIEGTDVNGTISSRIAANFTAVLSFSLQADTELNKSDIIWYVNSVEFKRGVYGVDENIVRLFPAEVSENTLDVGLKMGNEIYVKMVPKTGTSTGDPITSNSYVVENAYPEISSANILPQPPRKNVNMILKWDFVDFEKDVFEDELQTDKTIVKWFRKNPPLGGGIFQFEEITESEVLSKIVTDNTTKTSTIDGSILLEKQQWYAKLIPNDGFDDGEIFTTNIVTII